MVGGCVQSEHDDLQPCASGGPGAGEGIDPVADALILRLASLGPVLTGWADGFAEPGDKEK